jgi:predicted MFS family arabinose efflux permease
MKHVGDRADRRVAMNDARYRGYLLALLLVILALNYVDRLAVGLLLQDIKVDLGLTDTQLGLLTGIAFAFFYSVMGIPIARWADRGDRVTIISITTALWSAAVVLCGLAGNFLQLLLIRIGAAVGEAGCLPAANSLLADHFSRAERPRALGIYMLGAPLSAVLGYFVAGWFNEFYGWRTTIMILGVPGLAIALLVRFSLRDPRRAMSTLRELDSPVATVQPGLKEVGLTLWANHTFRNLLLCFSVLSFFSTGMGQWQPAFFVRSYAMQTGELGTWFMVISGGGGLLGTYWGGTLASRFAANNERLQLKALAIVLPAIGALWACIYLTTNRYLGFGLMGIAGIGATAVSGPLLATIQTVVPPRLRAVAVATMFLFANLIGMGLGPLCVGALSDALRAPFGDESLRYALLAMCPGFLWSGWYLWKASTTVNGDLQLAPAR